MTMKEVHMSARRLIELHGDIAESEAARKARKMNDRGDKQRAEDWQRVRKAIRDLRGEHVG